ncbi:MAG: hypothetical protein Q8920_05435 [Bacillota bacterium]|nr:hypothetical protein [Bacillota bacterium]
MLEPITKIMTDKSTGEKFCFTFFCDICKDSWDSVPVNYNQTNENVTETDEITNNINWKSDHDAAYERANLEAMQHFNRCPVCKRWVCDNCFCILGDRDVCRECAELDATRKR